MAFCVTSSLGELVVCVCVCVCVVCVCTIYVVCFVCLCACVCMCVCVVSAVCGWVPLDLADAQYRNLTCIYIIVLT